MRRALPSVVILENVSNLGKQDSPNMAFLWKSFDALGYSGACDLFKSTAFRLPQTRERIYIVLLNREAFQYSTSVATKKARTMLADAQKLQMPMEPLGKFLVQDDHPRVCGERERRMEAAQGDNKNMTGWKDTHKAFLANKGWTLQLTIAPPEVRDSPDWSLLPSREREVLGFHIASATEKDLLTCLDLTPRIDRTSCGRFGQVPTLTSSSKIWLHSVQDEPGGDTRLVNRLMIGYEMMLLQGFPGTVIDKSRNLVKDSTLADLAGNAFSAPVFLAVLHGLYSNLDEPKKRENAAPDFEDVLSMLAED